MATTTEIRRALAALLEDVDGECEVFPSRSPYDQGAGYDTRGFRVRVIVGEDSAENQERLDALIDPTGMKPRLEADDLGGMVSNVLVTESTGYRIYEMADGERLGAEWVVECWT